MASGWTPLKQLKRSLFNFADVCDWCSREPVNGSDGEQRELLRCSKCIFARYCGKEHQLLAWKTGIEDAWLHRLAHKCVCLDAKRGN